MKFKPLIFLIVLILSVSQLLFSGCGLAQGKKISGESEVSGKSGVSENSGAAGTDSAQIEGSATSDKVNDPQGGNTNEEVLAEDIKLKEEALEKEKKDKGLAEENSAAEQAGSLADTIKPEGNCDLVIITPPEFVSALTLLKEHKNKTGIITKLISLEDIYKSYDGRDEAEKVKYFLADYKKFAGLKYAMLVGNADKFPVRFTKTDRATAVAFDTAYYGATCIMQICLRRTEALMTGIITKTAFLESLQGRALPGL